MRSKATDGTLSLHLIAGTSAVLIAIDISPAGTKGLLGFAIRRIDHLDKKEEWLKGFRCFKETLPATYRVPDSTFDKDKHSMYVPTNLHPVQAFLWGDYTVKEKQSYTYEVTPLYGTPRQLQPGSSLSATVMTEAHEAGAHAIFFNCGIAGSQAYAHKFGNAPPAAVPDRAAYKWLSRGLEEALLQFIGQASGPTYSLHAAVYEFSYIPVLQAFAKASAAGAEVQIIYDRRPRGPYKETEAAVAAAGIGHLMIPREKTPSYIAHNKYIILSKDGKPVAVWTGSANFTEGGIFGQSNVGHIVRDADIAQQYLDYWHMLSSDPEAKALRVADINPLTHIEEQLHTKGMTAVFSPRQSMDLLVWYDDLIKASKSSLHFTAAFGVNELFAQTFAEESASLRFIMLEREGETFPEYAHVKSNRIAIGAVLEDTAIRRYGMLYQWVHEQLTNLNQHVRYLHTKYLLLDPLGEKPTIISGSANFSKASVKNNDENMMVITGDKRLADMFLGEFIRLYHHFHFRDIVDRILSDSVPFSPYLRSDDGWTQKFYAPGSPYARERQLFSASA